ncbi:MAG: hypothetical protein IPN08_17300 [Bacteroidales bacterium]|nr:hypothetical protein [Bacteroidales bacterium]
MAAGTGNQDFHLRSYPVTSITTVTPVSTPPVIPGGIGCRMIFIARFRSG